MTTPTLPPQAEGKLVLGASGVVGGFIVQRLVAAGQKPIAVSRHPRSDPAIDWVTGDLADPELLSRLSYDVIYCTADARLLADALPKLIRPRVKRVIVFSSTSILTKIDSEVAGEREVLSGLAAAERAIIRICEAENVGWTILRPTLIYCEGRDGNITPLARLIRRFGWMPLIGGGPGLRQPVHADDLAAGALAAAASRAAANKIYALPGGEILTYREMIGRVFDGVGRPRRFLPVPVFIWRGAFAIARPLFPGANVAMGLRMVKDMTFDASAAIEDLGWKPRAFHPQFERV